MSSGGQAHQRSPASLNTRTRAMHVLASVTTHLPEAGIDALIGTSAMHAPTPSRSSGPALPKCSRSILAGPGTASPTFESATADRLTGSLISTSPVPELSRPTSRASTDSGWPRRVQIGRRSWHQMSSRPPSTVMTWPVACRPAGSAIRRIQWAISSAVAMRWVGMRSRS